MLTRVRNSLMSRHEEISMPSSKIKEAIADVLVKEGYITSWRVEDDNKQGILVLGLKYKDGRPVIAGIKRVSKPSRRVYVGSDDIPPVLSGLGVSILSTPRGVMADRLARKQKVGGEILCEVW